MSGDADGRSKGRGVLSRLFGGGGGKPHDAATDADEAQPQSLESDTAIASAPIDEPPAQEAAPPEEAPRKSWFQRLKAGLGRVIFERRQDEQIHGSVHAGQLLLVGNPPQVVHGGHGRILRQLP